MTFQAWKIKLLNSMTFQVFHDLYEPWFTWGREAKTEKKYLRFKYFQEVTNIENKRSPSEHYIEC